MSSKHRSTESGIAGPAAGLIVLGLVAVGAVALNGIGNARTVNPPHPVAIAAASEAMAVAGAMARPADRPAPARAAVARPGVATPTAGVAAVPLRRPAPPAGGGGGCGVPADPIAAVAAGGGCGCGGAKDSGGGCGGGGGGGCGGAEGGGCGCGGGGGTLAAPAGRPAPSAAPVLAAADRAGGDRNPRHGGIVGMHGTDFLEIARTAEHEWRVYLSDSSRAAIAAEGGTCTLTFLGDAGELGSVDLVVSINRQFFAGRMHPPAGARKVRIAVDHPRARGVSIDMPFPRVVPATVADGTI